MALKPGSNKGRDSFAKNAPVAKVSASKAPVQSPVRHSPVAQAPVKPSVAPVKPSAGQEAEDKILFQDYFKSVGPRTYATQLKQAKNGNHYLVITEGKRDKESGEVRKTRVFVFSEDFSAFFKMLSNTAGFIREHPVPEDVKRKRAKYWEKHAGENPAPAAPAPIAPEKAAPAKQIAAPSKPVAVVKAGAPVRPAMKSVPRPAARAVVRAKK